MKLALEIGDAVDCARVFPLTLLVPLYAQPDITTGLRVVQKLPRILDTSENGSQENSLTQEMCILWVGWD